MSDNEMLWQRFKIGMYVECINAGDTEPGKWKGWEDSEKIEEGRIYTVASVHLGPDEMLTLWLEEVRRCKSAIREWGPLVGYCHTRFKPLREQNIEVFRQMCREVEKKEKV